jgi:hypothetical protein
MSRTASGIRHTRPIPRRCSDRNDLRPEFRPIETVAKKISLGRHLSRRVNRHRALWRAPSCRVSDVRRRKCRTGTGRAKRTNVDRRVSREKPQVAWNVDEQDAALVSSSARCLYPEESYTGGG